MSIYFLLCEDNKRLLLLLLLQFGKFMSCEYCYGRIYSSLDSTLFQTALRFNLQKFAESVGYMKKQLRLANLVTLFH